MSTTIAPRGARGTYSRGYLPHFDHQGLIHVVTFRLADALPEPSAAKGALAYADAQLDLGYGACVLRDTQVASVMAAALHHFNGNRYRLGPWVIMPNHVHVAFRPLSGHALATIVQSWKSFTAKRVNVLLGRTGVLWQREYFDRFVRNQRHLRAVIRYIEQNPVAAGLVRCADDWAFSSARDPSYAAALFCE